METFRQIKIKQLIFSLIACIFIPTLIVVVFSYWQKLVRVINDTVDAVPILALFWNIVQIALALGILLGVAWIIRKVMSYLKMERGPRREIDSGNLAIAIGIAFISSLVIMGVSGIFTNPVTNIVRILLSFIEDPTVADSSFFYDEAYLSPMKASVMMFTNIALFCWTAYWSFTFILGIVEDMRGENPSSARFKAAHFRENLHRKRDDWEKPRQLTNQPTVQETITQVPTPPVTQATQEKPSLAEDSTSVESPLLDPHLNATDNRLKALAEANERAQAEQELTEN